MAGTVKQHEEMTIKIDAKDAQKFLRKELRKYRGMGIVDKELQGLIIDFGRLEVQWLPAISGHTACWKMIVSDPASIDGETGKATRWASAQGATFGGCCTKLKRSIRAQQREEYRGRD